MFQFKYIWRSSRIGKRLPNPKKDSNIFKHQLESANHEEKGEKKC